MRFGMGPMSCLVCMCVSSAAIAGEVTLVWPTSGNPCNAPSLLADYIDSAVRQSGAEVVRAVDKHHAEFESCRSLACMLEHAKKLRAQELVLFECVPVNGHYALSGKRMTVAHKKTSRHLTETIKGNKATLLESAKNLVARLYAPRTHSGPQPIIPPSIVKPVAMESPPPENRYYGSGLWAYYNTTMPILSGGIKFYEATAFWSVPRGRKSEGSWATTQWMIAFRISRFIAPWGCDESPCDGETIDYDTQSYTLVYGHRYYPFNDDFRGFGFGWLVALGYYSEKEVPDENGNLAFPHERTESGDSETAVLDLYYTLRLGPMWLEPSVVFGLERRGDPELVFIPGLRAGLTL